jgi:predicted ATP-grasp superfamily ATP-dependent carboligase
MVSRVLVFDAQIRNSLAIIRSLGQKNIATDCAGEHSWQPAFFSKYCRNKIIYPSPSRDTRHFVNFVREIVEQEHYDMIIPVTDRTVIPLVKEKKIFEKYTKVPYPDYATLELAMNKEKTLRIAQDIGIPCPATHFFNHRDEIDPDTLEYPLISKPRISSGAQGFQLYTTKKEFLKSLSLLPPEETPPLLQEYIPHGGEIGVYTLFDRNTEPVALTVQRRIRSYPVTGGPSTLRETIQHDEAVHLAFRLLKAMHWQGLAMVEFRIDKRTNKPVLMEVNPRFWGSLQLSILAGVDFPYLLYQMTMHEFVKPVLDYKIGVQCRWLLTGDILWYLHAPHKLQNLREFVRLDIPDDIMSWEDPGPTFGVLAAVVYELFHRK